MSCYSVCRAYDGLFLPYQDQWVNQGGDGIPVTNVTYDVIDAHFAAIEKQGLHSLSHFSVAYFGVNISFPAANSTPAFCGTRPPFGLPAPCPNASGASKYLQVWQTLSAERFAL